MSDEYRLWVVKLGLKVLLGLLVLVLVISLTGMAGLSFTLSWLEEIPLWLKVVGVCLVLAFLLSIWSGDASTMWLIFIGSFAFVIVTTLATNVWEWLQGIGL